MKRVYLSITTASSFDRAINELQKYKKELSDKCAEFVNRLLEIGVEAAQDNSGNYRGFIVFRKHLLTFEDGVDGVLVATDGTKIVREWYRGGKVVSAEISPLLMAEFGSGWLAKVLDDIEGVGQGTFPNQTHAFDRDGWSWTTPDGEYHHSIGEAPTYPMHSAVLTMLFEVDRIGREVFGNG